MKSKTRGRSILKPEVVYISPHGLWLNIKGNEYALPYEDYPWFKDATIAQIENVQLLRESHLHWPGLDIDLELDSLEHPESYPLVYKNRKK